MPPPRLLLVINDAGFFLSHRLPLALGARDAGFDVHVATPPGDATRTIEEAGLPFHPIPLSRKGTSPLDEAKTVGALLSLYRRLRPDVVHHVTAKPILYGGVAARLARVPAVVHAVTGLGYVFISPRPRARLLRTAIRAAYRTATAHPNCAVIFQNEDDARVLGGAIRAREQLLVKGSGVDRRRFARAPLPDGVPIVVLPARLLWDKGVGELVEAARILAKRPMPVRVALVGGLDPDNPAGVPRDRVEAWVKEGSVEWWGARSDMPEVLASATVVCLPSYREGMSKALLEALAVGRPIVTTDVPGCRDAVTGDCAVLVPPRDAPALAAALGGLLDDRPRMERMAAAAARHGAGFDVELVVAETLSLYRRLLQRAGLAAPPDYK